MDIHGCCDVFAHDTLGSLALVADEGLWRPAQFETGAKSAPTIDDPAAKRLSLTIVMGESRVQIAFIGRDCIGEAHSINRNLCATGAHTRPGNEPSIPDQHRIV